MSERIITPVKHPDGSFALCNSSGDEYDPEVDKQPSVWALVRMNSKEYFITLPVTLEMLKTMPDYVEQSLIRIAEAHPFN